MPADSHAAAFVSLLRDDAAARDLLEHLSAVDWRGSPRPSFLLPPVRGIDFFASTADQPAVDAWWAANVPAAALPVYLLCHEPGLARWIGGLDGVFLVVASGASSSEYTASAVVEGSVLTAATALLAAAVARLAPRSLAGDMSVPAPQTVLFRRPAFPALLSLDGPAPAASAQLVVRDVDPLEALARESAGRAALWMPPAEAPIRDTRRTRGTQLRRGRERISRSLGRHGVATADAELAARLAGRGPTIVVVGSRKGGVGKTSHAAGIAIAAGEVLDAIGHSVALVDANIANPDAWGQLALPLHAATVRDLAAALAVGLDPPGPVYAATPALACYPERRDGAEYSRTDIRRLATHLRARHTLVVVDMSNRLPDPTGGPEATAAAYWLEEADVLVLPTATSRQDFNGVLDYLDVADLPPVVVPYIVSSARRNRRHPVTVEYLDAIASRVHRMVPIPDEADTVRLAGMTGAAVQDVSPRMHVAYRQLTGAVANLPGRPRR